MFMISNYKKTTILIGISDDSNVWCLTILLQSSQLCFSDSRESPYRLTSNVCLHNTFVRKRWRGILYWWHRSYFQWQYQRNRLDCVWCRISSFLGHRLVWEAMRVGVGESLIESFVLEGLGLEAVDRFYTIICIWHCSFVWRVVCGTYGSRSCLTRCVLEPILFS